jgi:hypothetical protein
MVDKLKNALNKGFESFDQRTKNLSDIKQLVERVRASILEVSHGTVGFKIEREISVQNVLNSFLINSELKESKNENTNNIVSVFLKESPAKEIKLTNFSSNINGFPCSIVVSGNKLVAHDIEALEDYFASLLSSANTVEAIKTLMAEIKSSD